MQKFYFVGLIWLALSTVLAALEPDAPISTDKAGLALDGYDVVAYFLDAKDKKGSSEWSSRYRDATWYFSSEEHKQLFDREPEKYMPEFGGFCAYAISRKRTRKGAGKYGQVNDGKLYFSADFITQKRYNLRRKHYNEKARNNWQEVKEKILAEE